MNWNWLPGKSATVDIAPSRLDSKKLRALIDQATSDSADESDEHAGNGPGERRMFRGRVERVLPCALDRQRTSAMCRDLCCLLMRAGDEANRDPSCAEPREPARA